MTDQNQYQPMPMPMSTQQQPQQPMQQPMQQPVQTAPQPQPQPQPMTVPGVPGPGGPMLPQTTSPMAPPALYIPVDEEAILASYKKAKAAVSGGANKQYAKFLGPQGQTRWKEGVHTGYEGAILAHILPSWAQGKNFFHEVRSHFFYSPQHPQGTSVGCVGEGCLICAAREAGLNHPDPAIQDHAKNCGRVGKKYKYNILQLEYPEAHMGDDGIMRPFILDASSTLHVAIGAVIAERGLANIIDPMAGRPMVLKKIKTGKEERDVDYQAIDRDPTPIPQIFWPALQNLHDLEREQHHPTTAEQTVAVQAMRLPMPNTQTAAFNPVPQPAYSNPYTQPQQPQPAYSNPYTQPQQSQSQPRPVYQPPQQMSIPQQPYSAHIQTQPPQVASPPPPPVQSTSVFTPYPAQGAGQVPVQTPAPMQQPVPVQQPVPQTQPGMSGLAPENVPQGQPLTKPLAPHITLDGGREKCFGNYNASDRWCLECPEWIRNQCVPQSQQPGQLDQLQNQLAGQ